MDSYLPSIYFELVNKHLSDAVPSAITVSVPFARNWHVHCTLFRLYKSLLMRLLSPCQSTSTENGMQPAKPFPSAAKDNRSPSPHLDLGSPSSSPMVRLPTKHHYCRSEGQGPSTGTAFSKLLDTVLGSSFSVPKRIETRNDSSSQSSLVSASDSTIMDTPSPQSMLSPDSVSEPSTSTSPDVSATCVSRNILFTSSLKVTGSPTFNSPSSAGKPKNKRILPRLLATFTSPAKDTTFNTKLKGKKHEQTTYDDLSPLDGEEGELVDDEACFVETRGLDILTSLPPEIALEILDYVDLRTIFACLGVSRSWSRLASDPFIWRNFFYDAGWEINKELALKNSMARLCLTPRNSPTRLTRHSLLSHRSSMNSSNTRHTLALTASQNKCSLAPLSLDWKSLYEARAKIERRICGNFTPGIHLVDGSVVGEEPKVMVLTGHTDSVYCLEFDHEKIVTGSRDRTIKVWSLQSGVLKATLSGHSGSVLSLKFDSSGFMVSGSSDCTILVWDLNKGNVQKRLNGHEGGVLDLKFDRQWIVSCSKDTVVRVWNRATLELYHAFRGHDGPVNAVGLQDGKIVSASGDMKIILWDIVAKCKLQTFSGHEAGLACIEFKDDLICSGSNDNSIKVWSASTGQCLTTLHGHKSLVRTLSFNSVTGRLVSGSYDRTVKIWNIHNGQLVREFKNIHESHIFDTKFDAAHIISTSHDRKIVVLDWSYGLDASLFL